MASLTPAFNALHINSSHVLVSFCKLNSAYAGQCHGLITSIKQQLLANNVPVMSLENNQSPEALEKVFASLKSPSQHILLACDEEGLAIFSQLPPLGAKGIYIYFATNLEWLVQGASKLANLGQSIIVVPEMVSFAQQAKLVDDLKNSLYLPHIVSVPSIAPTTTVYGEVKGYALDEPNVASPQILIDRLTTACIDKLGYKIAPTTPPYHFKRAFSNHIYD